MKALGITPKQLEILILLYRFRFLSSKQVQEILGHKDRKRTREWLSDLVSKGYVKSSYERNKLGENNKPAIFHLAAAAKALKDQKECQTFGFRHLYGEDARSQRFVDHSLLLADICIHLRKVSEEEGTALHFLTKSDQAVFEAFPKPLPDAYIAIKTSPMKTKRYFLEIIDPETPRFALRGIIQRHINYSDSGEWNRHHNDKVGPTILLICPNEETKKYLDRYCTKTLEDTRIVVNFSVTLEDNVSTSF